ncbi:MAG TPA: IclR family transcriptional regulator [Nocardioidaceae bacterium]|nr:IclR family transcriptional regulator [Nocardioidaceae bacterium]
MPVSPPQTDMVGKALLLLTRLGDYPEGVVASDLARLCEFPLSTAHRLLGALVREGYAQFDPSTKRYSIGLRVFQLAQGVLRAHGFTRMARPVLEEVSAATREATLLAVRDGERQLYVYSIEGPQQVRVVGEPGRHGPLHCTSQGKVLIAFAQPGVRDYLVEHVPLPPCGPNSITSRSRFREEIALVRERGYALADEEHEAGIRAIGVPVIDGDHATASLATAAPAYRMTIEQLVDHLPALNEAAKALAVMMSLR